MKLALAMICPNVYADSLITKRTCDGFAQVKPDGKGWTWEPHQVGVATLLPKPTVPYISQRAAYEGLQRAINALLREGLNAIPPDCRAVGRGAGDRNSPQMSTAAKCTTRV